MISSTGVYRQGVGEATVLPQSSFDPVAFAKEAAMERKRVKESEMQAIAGLGNAQVGDGWEQDMKKHTQDFNTVKQGIVEKIKRGEIHPSQASAMLREQADPIIRSVGYSKEQKKLYHSYLDILNKSPSDKYDREESVAALEQWRTGKSPTGESLVPEGMTIEEWRSENMPQLSEGYDDLKYTKQLMAASGLKPETETSFVVRKDSSGKEYTEKIEKTQLSPAGLLSLFNSQAALSGTEKKPNRWVENRYAEADADLKLTVDENDVVTTKSKSPIVEQTIKTFQELYGKKPETADEWVAAHFITTRREMGGVKDKRNRKYPPKDSKGFSINFGGGGGNQDIERDLNITQGDIDIVGLKENKNYVLMGSEAGSETMHDMATVDVYYKPAGGNVEVYPSEMRRNVMWNGALTTLPIAKKDIEVVNTDGSITTYKKGDVVGMNNPEYLDDHISQIGKDGMEYKAMATGRAYRDGKTTGPYDDVFANAGDVYNRKINQASSANEKAILTGQLLYMNTEANNRTKELPKATPKEKPATRENKFKSKVKVYTPNAK